MCVNVCLLLSFLDEFEASAVPKAKETEAQSEPEDGEEDSREEGKFLKYQSSLITDCNAESRSPHYSLVRIIFSISGC